MGRGSIATLRTMIVVMLVGLVIAQAVVLPVLGAEVVASAPEVSSLRWWVLAGGVCVLGAVQASLICVWRLLSMVRRGTVFSTGALRFVDTIMACVVIATVLVVAMNAMLSNANVNPPLVFLTLVGATVGGVGLALLIVVLRALLVQAAGLRRELNEVI